jgi:hypothetical protein
LECRLVFSDRDKSKSWSVPWLFCISVNPDFPISYQETARWPWVYFLLHHIFTFLKRYVLCTPRESESCGSLGALGFRWNLCQADFITSMNEFHTFKVTFSLSVFIRNKYLEKTQKYSEEIIYLIKSSVGSYYIILTL